MNGTLVTLGALRPTGFELCGDDQQTCRFVDAELAGGRVMLSPAAAGDTRVRFCWSVAPLCNLYDTSGMPAGPFETAIR